MVFAISCLIYSLNASWCSMQVCNPIYNDNPVRHTIVIIICVPITIGIRIKLKQINNNDSEHDNKNDNHVHASRSAKHTNCENQFDKVQIQ